MENMTVITFEDHGQDFLTWTVDPAGKIVDCQPFQFSIWRKWSVRMKEYRVGDHVDLMATGQRMTIKYPIEKIEFIPCQQFKNL